MAGGRHNYPAQKARPGAYVNVSSRLSSVGSVEGVSGVVGLPLSLGFGPTGQLIEVDGTVDLSLFGSGHQERLISEALKGAATVLLYRVNGGNAAKGAIGSNGSITAQHGGVFGNSINVTISPNANASGTFTVDTSMQGRVVDSQVASTVAELEDNALVSFSGTGALAEATVTLTGGTDSPATAESYAGFFNALQTQDFNTLALPVEDEAVKSAGVNFVKRMRDEEGKHVQAVMANHDADHEAVINVRNGVVLANGTEFTPAEATAYVAGASAGAGIAESLTYNVYPGAIDAKPRLTNSETITALLSGELVFTEKRGEVVIEQDINSLTSFTSSKGQAFSKNRVVRVVDNIANNTKQTFEDNFLGRINNDVDGRELFKANRIDYFNSLQAAGAIENFEIEDIEVLPGNTKDSIVMNAQIQPTDAMEKLYVTVEVV